MNIFATLVLLRYAVQFDRFIVVVVRGLVTALFGRLLMDRDVAAAQDSGAKRYSVISSNRMNTVLTYTNSESEKYTYKQDKFPHHWRGRICVNQNI